MDVAKLVTETFLGHTFLECMGTEKKINCVRLMIALFFRSLKKENIFIHHFYCQYLIDIE